MKKSELEFKNVILAHDLVSNATIDCIEKIFTIEEQHEIFVSKIDTNYVGGIEFCSHYGIDLSCGANCLICECKRGQVKKYVALVVPVGYKYNMSSTVRKHTNSRMVSVAPLDYVLENTNMEYGSINPFGLPENWEIFIDPMVLSVDKIICGSGKKNSKLMLPSRYLLKLPNAKILDNLAKK